MNAFSTTPESEHDAFGFPVSSRGVIVLCLLISLAGIGNHDLWTPDEPREAALSLNMSRTGDWLIPRLAGEPFVEKPPLFYIVASFFLSIAGQGMGNTAALRLTSALWGLGTLGM
ncbi:MAG: glycosyl transferase, partial [Verrucomicrobia bacterium]|nr:glycosyl transferase [Verrucomicrobiota bacterium]